MNMMMFWFASKVTFPYMKGNMRCSSSNTWGWLLLLGKVVTNKWRMDLGPGKVHDLWCYTRYLARRSHQHDSRASRIYIWFSFEHIPSVKVTCAQITWSKKEPSAKKTSMFGLLLWSKALELVLLADAAGVQGDSDQIHRSCKRVFLLWKLSFSYLIIFFF